MPIDSYTQRVDPVQAAMKGVFDDLATSRQGVQNDLAGNGVDEAMGYQPRPTTDAIALAMGLAGAGGQAEPPRAQARRILSGRPQPTSGNVSIDDAMGVNSLRTRLAAQRTNSLSIAPYIPNASTPPEEAANNLNYLDMMTLRGAGDPLGAPEAPGAGSGTSLSGKLLNDPLLLNLDAPQGSMVDQRRARVQSMSDFGNANLMTPAEKNRRAIIAAMNGVQIPDPNNPGKMITRPPSVDEAMLGFSKAGGTGLGMDSVTRAMDAEAMAKRSGDKTVKPGPVDELKGMIGAYKEALASKDYVAAQFLAQKMGHKFPTKGKDADGLDVETPFTPEMLPGYKPEPAAAAQSAGADAANSAPNAEAKPTTYKSADDVIAAFKSGSLDRAAAKEILQKQFGHQ